MVTVWELLAFIMLALMVGAIIWGGVMDHDPLCVCSRVDHEHFYYTIPAGLCMTCKCDDIARVRADERQQAAQRITGLLTDNNTQWDHAINHAIRAAQGDTT